MENRALGAFVGLAVGDALGTTIEFMRRDTYQPVTDMTGGGPFRLKPGEWTDDTSMALCLADSLLAHRGDLDAADLAGRFVNWWKRGENSVTGHCFDIGNATAAALGDFIRSGKPVGSDHPQSAGNGGIMRLAPAVLAGRGDAGVCIDLARAQSRVTHAAAECLDAAELLARVLNGGIAGSGMQALNSAQAVAFGSPAIAGIAGGGWRGKQRKDIRSSGYVVDTLEAAMWSVGTSDSFEEAVLKAVNLGDDADTVGAVTGQIAGAIWGYEAIPLHWRQRIAWRDRLTETGRGLWSIRA